MKDFIWQFAYNLQLPVTIAAIVVGILTFIVIKSSHDGMRYLTSVEEKYGILEWRQWTAANVAAIMAIIWLLVMAVPEPNFKREVVYRTTTKTVEKKVPVQTVRYAKERIVYKMPTYLGAFAACRTALTNNSSGLRLGTEDVAHCHKIATEASMPPYRVLTRTIHAPNNYWDIFKKCNEAYDIEQDKPGVAERRNARMMTCKDVATTGATVH